MEETNEAMKIQQPVAFRFDEHEQVEAFVREGLFTSASEFYREAAKLHIDRTLRRYPRLTVDAEAANVA